MTDIQFSKKKGKFYLLERLLELIFWVCSPKNDFGQSIGNALIRWVQVNSTTKVFDG